MTIEHARNTLANGDQCAGSQVDTSHHVGFSVYVHFPFCQRKCPYCDFNSHVRIKGWDEEVLLGAYIRELDHIVQRSGPRIVDSIFFGGGTPSLMRPVTVQRLIDAIAARWGLRDDAEVTLEANPGSVEAERFRGYRSAGVNRVSIGVQALNDRDLRALGRIHSVGEALAALRLAGEVFDRFSFDLIYARPDQDVGAWRNELREALCLSGGHLSLYQLTIEPETAFAKLHAAGKLVVPDSELALQFYEVTQEIMECAGLPAYEISNHAKLGMECLHNLIYWRYGEYAGIGPGAHGRLVLDGNRYAIAAERDPDVWLSLIESQGHGFGDFYRLGQSQVADEMLLMGLRLSEGVNLPRLAELGGVCPSSTSVDELVDLGLVQWSDCGTLLRATPKGRFVLNEVVYRLSAGLMPLQSATARVAV